MNKKAILVVSFGTSFTDTREKTINKIENEIKNSFPEYEFYSAFTSEIIIKILKDRDNIVIYTVKEALEQMIKNGIKEVIVQPTHILNGIENDKMLKEIQNSSDSFNSILIGAPLLTSTKDYQAVVEGLKCELPDTREDEAIVYMGHGTDHDSNACYAALECMFHDYGMEDIYIGTVEAYPSISEVIKKLAKKEYKRVMLIPFMLVAGDHAKNDMAGDNEDSWKTVLEEKGYEVRCMLKGLGEFKFISDIYLDHINKAKNVLVL